MQQQFLNRDTRTVKRRKNLAEKISAIIEKFGFVEGYMPAVYPMRASFPRVGADDRLKLVDSDGKVLCVSDDAVTALLQGNDGSLQRLYGMSEQYRLFGEARNEACYAAAIVGLSGIEPEAEMITVAAKIMQKLGIEIGQIILSHTAVLQGIVEQTSKKPATKQDIMRLLGGEVATDYDLEAYKFLSEIAAAKGGIGVIGQIAEKITNKTSVDGLVDIFELSKLLDEYGYHDMVAYDLSYLGREYDNGISFFITDIEGYKVIEGGRHDYKNGDNMERAVSISIYPDYLCSIHKELIPSDDKFDVALGVADSVKALRQAYKLKNVFADEGLKTSVLYRVTKEDVASYGKVLGIDSVVYIEDDGNILYI